MSGEFRQAYGTFLYDVLDNISEEGRHEVSKALLKIYNALAPLERDCAWTEACDSGNDRPYMGLLDAMPKITEAFKDLDKIHRFVMEIAEAAIQRGGK